MVRDLLHALGAQRSKVDPFSLEPGTEAAKAVWNGMAEYQPAWPFTKLEPDNLDEFIERLVGWFGAAASGQLRHPSSMPERASQNSWRPIPIPAARFGSTARRVLVTQGCSTGRVVTALDRTAMAAAWPRLA